MATATPPPETATIAVAAECHCSNFRATFTLPTSSFPLKASICHCTTCRKTAGHILPTWAVIPSTQRPDVSALTAYTSSNSLTRFFCPKCGARIADFEANEWDIATGLLDKIGDGLLNRVQIWLEDTKDTGGAIWLKLPYSECHMRGRTSERLAFEDVKEMAESRRKETKAISLDSTSAHCQHQNMKGDWLNASCHCGAVAFQIARPDTSTNESASNKYSAGLDACTSCRKVSGCEITSWAIVPRDRISTCIRDVSKNSDSKGNNQHPLDLLDMSALTYYKSSPAVTRGFCSTCGANVFYYRHRGNMGKEDTIDIAAGLLESRVGVRAEDWLAWDHYGDDVVGYSEDALDKGLVEGLVRGIQEDDMS